MLTSTYCLTVEEPLLLLHTMVEEMRGFLGRLRLGLGMTSGRPVNLVLLRLVDVSSVAMRLSAGHTRLEKYEIRAEATS